MRWVPILLLLAFVSTIKKLIELDIGGVFMGLAIMAGLILIMMFYKPKEKSNTSVDRMSGVDFEYMCADLLRSGNFRSVEVTPASNDYGADIIAEDYYGNRWVIQCKRYKGNLSNSPVQEVVGSKAHYRANKAAVITTAGYTKGAKRLAKDNEVVLIDRKGLEKMMRGREITLENLVLYDIITED